MALDELHEVDFGGVVVGQEEAFGRIGCVLGECFIVEAVAI